MGPLTGRVSEIRITPEGDFELFFACRDRSIPSAGQYLQVYDQDDPHTILGSPVFLTEKSERGFWGLPFHPAVWQPGSHLTMLGPFGHGFDLPKAVQRLGLVALSNTAARLLPLVSMASHTNTAVTLFTNQHQSKLPAFVEVYPLKSLKDALDWPDFMALDVPQDDMSSLREMLGLTHRRGLPCPAQVLVTVAMPCAGKAQCGVCAIKSHRGWKLVCEDGPVFDLNTLDW